MIYHEMLCWQVTHPLPATQGPPGAVYAMGPGAQVGPCYMHSMQHGQMLAPWHSMVHAFATGAASVMGVGIRARL